MKKSSLAMALVALLVGAPATWAMSSRPLKPSEVAAESTDVVIATVTEVTDIQEPRGNHVQRLVLTVRERWKGREAQSLVRTQVVSVADRDKADRDKEPTPRVIAGNPLLLEGETYLLFLRGQTATARVPLTTAGELGLFTAQQVGGQWQFATLDKRRVVKVTGAAIAFSTDSEEPSRASEVQPGPGVTVVVAPPEPAVSNVATEWRAVVQRAHSR